MKNNLGQHKKIYEKQHITSSAVCFKKIMFPLQQKNVSCNILSKKHTFAKKKYIETSKNTSCNMDKRIKQHLKYTLATSG